MCVDVTSPYHISCVKKKNKKTKSRFSENNFTCLAVKPFMHRTFNKSTFSPDSKCFRACLSPHQVNQTKSQVKKSCLLVVHQVFHIPLLYVNYGRCSVLLHCFMSAVTQNDPKTAALVYIAHSTISFSSTISSSSSSRIRTFFQSRIESQNLLSCFQHIYLFEFLECNLVLVPGRFVLALSSRL